MEKNREELTDIAMHIISYAGVAKSNYLEGLSWAKQDYLLKSQESIEKGDTHFKKAHRYHQKLLSKEADEEVSQVSLLLVHAETQLMLAETIKLLIKEFLWIIKKRGYEK